LVKLSVMLYLFILSLLTFLTPFTWLLFTLRPKRKNHFTGYSTEVNRLLEID
jgi:hypothetical protein